MGGCIGYFPGGAQSVVIESRSRQARMIEQRESFRRAALQPLALRRVACERAVSDRLQGGKTQRIRGKDKCGGVA
jgi:hypothetical protein